MKLLLRPAKLQRRRSTTPTALRSYGLTAPSGELHNSCDRRKHVVSVSRGECHLSLTAPSEERTQGMWRVGPRIFSSTDSAKNH